MPGFLEQQGLIGPKPVQAVATHIHFDHSGGLHQFEKFSIHSLEAGAIRQGDNFVTSTLFFSASEFAVPPYQGWKISDYKVKAAEPYTVVEESHVFDLGDRSLRVVHLPGHTPGNIGLIDERARILLTGDVMYESDALIDWLPQSNINAYIQSCRRLQDLSSHVDCVFPGHSVMFDGRRLHFLASEYISRAGACHKVFTTLLKGVSYRIWYLKQNTRLTFLLSAVTMPVAAAVALIKFKMNEVALSHPLGGIHDWLDFFVGCMHRGRILITRYSELLIG